MTHTPLQSRENCTQYAFLTKKLHTDFDWFLLMIYRRIDATINIFSLLCYITQMNFVLPWVC